ncbi:MAG: hypothetical protein E6R07_07700 [Nevskiaceae bacterium]|nr:MAG: hypothetical protein E6R07_07700 [Nevskiaceae bacterium]
MTLTGKRTGVALLIAACALITGGCGSNTQTASGNSNTTPVDPPNPPTPVTSDLPLGHAGRWITDAQGRVVVIHGMNYVKKWPTKLPDGTQTLDPAADGFGDNDLQWLQDNGFNGLRLGIQFYGIEPQPGVYDDRYIAQVASMARLALAHGVRPLLDFHQDDYSPALDPSGGDGFPAWMVLDDGLPHQPDVGFPYSQFTMPAMLRAWDHFWANDPTPDGNGLQDHAAKAAAHVVAQFAGMDGLLGYESLNEPWPGSQYPTCLVPLGCPQFDAELTAFNQRLAKAVNAVDSRHLIFAEPNVMFNDAVDTQVGALGLPNGGFSFHVYCLLAGSDSNSEMPGGAQACPTMEQMAFDNADKHVAKTQEALLMTEFGATPAAEVIARLTADADAHMVSWLWWAYSIHIGLDATADVPDAKLDAAAADLLVRAYPRAVSGTPQSWAFDPVAHRFTLSYSTARADGHGAFPAGAVSEIFLPLRHYPKGYQISVTGGTVVSNADACVLQIASSPGAQTVQVTVMPR